MKPLQNIEIHAIEVVMEPQKSECNLRRSIIKQGREEGNLTYQQYLWTEAPS